MDIDSNVRTTEANLSLFPPFLFCCAALDLSYDGAAQGATLIRNNNSALPLSTSIPSIAVIGPNSHLAQGRCFLVGFELELIFVCIYG